jgi:glycosyltransferase involved in cell wall biosynthesis
VLDQNYPSSTRPYGDVFVQTRARTYASAFDAEVLVLRPYASDPSSVDCGVRVESARSGADALAIAHEFQPDAVLAHFVDATWVGLLRALRMPTVVWLHGFEALAWYRRLFNIADDPARFAAYAARNTRQLLSMRRLIRNDGVLPAIGCVFVSRWLRDAACADLRVDPATSAVIPNPIDVDRFTFVPKDPDLVNRVLLLRSFAARTYATDVASAAAVEVLRGPSGAAWEFTFVGAGRWWDRDTAPLRGHPQVELRNTFVSNEEIPLLHRQHGVFLSPSRLDTQGVSMCEAMASGLVPVTSAQGGIPEFVEDGVSGIVTRSPGELVSALRSLAAHPDRFQSLSEGAARTIRSKCNPHEIAARELAFVERVVELASRR